MQFATNVLLSTEGRMSVSQGAFRTTFVAPRADLALSSDKLELPFNFYLANEYYFYWKIRADSKKSIDS